MSESQDYMAEHARTAAQMDADVGAQQVADVYAKALLGTTENAGRTEEILSEFDLLVTRVLRRFPKFEAILASGLISPEDKAGILDRVLAGQVSPMMVRFLKVVARHGRLDCLRVIHRRAHALYDEMRGWVPVRVTTAAPVDRALADRIGESLRAVIGGEPIVEQVTDPELIGGVVVRVGDTVFDGSIANQLNTIREQMIDRSIHEIQSRRDRFRDPAGN